MKIDDSYRTLGRTGLQVSPLALGTVEIGVQNYGIHTPNHAAYPIEQDAIRLVHAALDAGINLIDTARDYGSSETILGKALRNRRARVVVATKVNPLRPSTIQPNGKQFKKMMLTALDDSLRELQTDYIDIWQIHNVNEAVLAYAQEVAQVFDTARQAGKIRWTGGSFYGAALPLTALDMDLFDVMQLTYSVLDRRIEEKVLPQAQRQDVGIVVRSVLLKGVLTERADYLPPRLHKLQAASRDFRQVIENASLRVAPAQVAIAFALAQPQISATLVGMSSMGELEDSLRATHLPLPSSLIKSLATIQIDDETLLDPSTWGLP